MKSDVIKTNDNVTNQSQKCHGSYRYRQVVITKRYILLLKVILKSWIDSSYHHYFCYEKVQIVPLFNFTTRKDHSSDHEARRRGESSRYVTQSVQLYYAG